MPERLAASKTRRRLNLTLFTAILQLVPTEFFDDEYDPLAPMIDAAPADVDESSDADDEVAHADTPTHNPDGTESERFQDDEELGAESDGGISGGNGIVRIWFDEHDKLTKVRVSPVWFKRLGPGHTLEQAFYEAFARVRLRVAEDVTVEPISVDEADFGEIPPLTPENISAYVEMMSEHRERWLAKVEEASHEPPAPEPTFTAKSSGVTLTLAASGLPKKVEFDEAWLDEAQVGSICSNVSAAAYKAYEQFEQYVPEPNERDEELRTMAAEQEYLLAGFQRLLDPRR